MRIAKVGVVGAGAMGSGIAALVASAGLPVVLLDVPGADDRRGPARAGVQRALKARPAAFMHPERARLIALGNIEDDLGLLADCDWVVEAIVEQVAPKRALYEQLESLVRPAAMVSSNTSGIPIATLLEGRSTSFRQRFLGTHFFNPPRYLHLLEIIPTPDTDPARLAAFRAFSERTLGKGVVIAKDVPGFIANRLGLFGLVHTMRAMQDLDLTIDEVDALTGALIGRPKSATFRTGDISGLDVLVHVTAELSATTGEDFALPDWVHALVARGLLGEKTGAGFYRKTGRDIHTLNWKTGDYAPAAKPDLRELAFAQSMSLGERLNAITGAGGRYAEFLRRVMFGGHHYTLTKTPEISPDIVSVDRAMEWGYGWESGPYQQMDMIGVDALRAAFSAMSLPEPVLLQTVHEGFYRILGNGARQLTFQGRYTPVEEIPAQIALAAPWVRHSNVDTAPDAAVLELGGGVLLLEFRSKMNTVGEGVLRMLEAAVARVTHGGYVGLVIGNDDPRTFTAGADLVQVAQLAARGDWATLERAVRTFQSGVMSLRQVPFPVVVAPFGLTLGGGAELTLHAARVQAHAELYMGLVEVGVGLIPAAGGTKELLFRFTSELARYEDADLFDGVKRAFKLIATAVTSGSALDARALGFLRDGDRITMNRDRLITDAKTRVLDVAADYVAPPPRTIRALGREAIGNLAYAAWAAREAGQATAHDVSIAQKLAYVLAGGDGPPRDVTEQDILDLEREAFLSLLGTKETQDRIAHMLKTGKALRN
jgi:3-hydroxyacyl-CoA dehydrogenase